MNIKLHKSLAIGALAVGPLLNAGNLTITLPSEGDGYFHNESGSSYDYWDGTSTVNKVHYEFWGSSDSVIQRTAYLQFDLSSVPAGAQIGSATLNLYVTEIHYGSDSPSGGWIKHVANSSSATGLASQKLGGNEIVVEMKDQPAGWMSLDVSTFIQNDIANGYSYAAFSGNYNGSGYFRNSGFSFVSADTATDQPYLSITTVPEPGVTAAAIALMTGLFALRHQRRGRAGV